LDTPLRPLPVAPPAEATCVAHTTDVDTNHMVAMLTRAAAHEGSAFIEVYQNCKIFNDGVFEYATDKSVKADHVCFLEHGKPLVYGKDRKRGVRLRGIELESVTLGDGVTEKDLLVHDEHADKPTLAFLLSQMVQPELPEVMGVLRDVKRPTFEGQMMAQSEQARSKAGPGSLA